LAAIPFSFEPLLIPADGKPCTKDAGHHTKNMRKAIVVTQGPEMTVIRAATVTTWAFSSQVDAGSREEGAKPRREAVQEAKQLP
jgi:hypothetical protein